MGIKDISITILDCRFVNSAEDMFPWVCLCILTTISSGVQSQALEAQDNDDVISQSLRTFLPPWIATRSLNGSLTRMMDKSSKGAFYGQSGEDKHAAQRYFHNMHNGIFLEMGGLDGKTYSNSKHFEESKDWWVSLRSTQLRHPSFTVK